MLVLDGRAGLAFAQRWTDYYGESWHRSRYRYIKRCLALVLPAVLKPYRHDLGLPMQQMKSKSKIRSTKVGGERVGDRTSQVLGRAIRVLRARGGKFGGRAVRAW